MLNEIIAIYAIPDDLLQALGHDDDIRRQMSDAEIINPSCGLSTDMCLLPLNSCDACGGLRLHVQQSGVGATRQRTDAVVASI
ncbi:hypothetical protein LC586_35940 [Nostoc sp. CHAB 5714]|uniref:Uncharacterized protein n=1 Tax=Nostoc favosum CHAB5714 TaxID=2780399 RepID=A0ABS8IJN8_9NOSO|nr:hypothetical protein [Nostoc favosum]MCC5604407.1 hypothetical protein [Nostoc favosum CHAB5714]